MSVTLQPITKENYEQVITLQVAPDQKEFVATNVYSLAEAKVYPEFVPLAIYADETIVGFLMVGSDDAYPGYWIHRLMVDVQFQRHGYGRAAMQALLEQLQREGQLREVLISYEPHNEVARRLYASLGFVETGEIFEGEAVARLKLE
ncbi:MAG: GNAT family N-acetyltransferase [Anaerolineales bacterium]